MNPLICLVNMDSKFDNYASNLLSNRQNIIKWNNTYTKVCIKNKKWCVIIIMNDRNNTVTILSSKNAPEYK